MKSRRLTNTDREYILSAITEEVDSQVNNLLKEFSILIKEKLSIRGKIKCLLYDNFNTTKQLKEGFPEDYSILETEKPVVMILKI